MEEYLRAINVLETGSLADLEQLAAEIPGFPEGVDPYIGRRWIINAIDTGSVVSIRWMLGKGVDLNFRDDEGGTPLHSAIDRARGDKYDVLETLIVAAAPLNVKGFNDWTPAHLAAARDDVEALRILVRHGADLSIRTDIDNYATPLEEARHLGKLKAVGFLESV